MADPSLTDPVPPNTDLATDFDSLPIPPIDPAIFSENFISDLGGPFDGNFDDLDFTFDDLYLPSDTEDFLNSIPAPIDPPGSDALQFSTYPSPDVTRVSNSCGLDQISGDQSSSGARFLNSMSPGSCQVSGDRISDVAKFLNVSSPESSQESGNKGSNVDRVLNYPSLESETHNREVAGPESSQGSGNCGSAVSETLNCPSPDSGNCALSVAYSPKFAKIAINGVVDQNVKLEEEGNNCMMKRKKESEDVNSESRTSKYRRSNAGDNPIPTYDVSGTSEGEDKKKTRLMRNRESAQLSRQRKKHYVEELEDKVRTMHSTIQDLNTKISYVMAENASLRQQLSGGAMCPPPVPPPGMYPHPPMAPMGYPWMPYPPYVVKPQGSQVPLVPIPRLKPQQPSPAPKAKKVESKKTEGKTKKVASVSFLGLLFFILLFGGLVPMVNVKFGGMLSVPDRSSYFSNRFYEQHGGKVLTVNGHLNGSNQNKGMGLSNGRFGTGNNFPNTIHCGRCHVGGVEPKVEQKEGSQAFPGSDEFVQPGNSSVPLVASLYVPRNDKLVKIDGNLIIHSVLASEKSMASLKDSGMKSSKETGLAVAGNMPPAIPLTGRNNGRHPHLYRRRALGSGSANNDNLKSTPADGKLQQWFQEGLAGPMLSSGMCTEVFQFDVSPAPGAIVPSTSVMNVSAEHHQNATQLNKGRNRRILHGAPISLAASQKNFTEEHVGRNPDKDDFQGNNSLSSMVVSVLVDPRESGDIDSDGVMGPKSLTRIFVVVLIDSVKYVTYSCMLPLKGSVASLVTA